MALSPTVKKIQPGSCDRLNKLGGVSSIFTIKSEAIFNTYADRVMHPGILVQFTDNTIHISDGMTFLKDLPPIVDEQLTNFEKETLTNSLDSATGTYTHGAKGVAVLDNTAKLYEQDMKMLEGIDTNGDPTTDPAEAVRYQIKQDYLGWLFDSNDSRQDALDNGAKFRLDLIPNSARAGLTYVPDYETMLAFPDDSEAKRGLVFVIDAAAVWEAGFEPVRGDEQQAVADGKLVSGDPTVEKGAAMYAWTEVEGVMQWVKIHEYESLDLNFDDIRTNYKTVNEAGAVMYDHNVFLNPEDCIDLLFEEEPGPAPTPELTIPSGQHTLRAAYGGTMELEVSDWEPSAPGDDLVLTEYQVSTDPEGTNIVLSDTITA